MNIENIEKILNNIDLSMYDSCNNMKDFNTVIGELSNKWNELNNKNKDTIKNIFKQK